MTGEVLVNVAGHAAGVFLFGNILYLIARSGGSVKARQLPEICAGIALLWNLLSLAGLLVAENGSLMHRVVAAASFSALSLLPAVLLEMSLPAAFRLTVRTGYLLSASAVAAHWAELLHESAHWHRLGLAAITVGFGVLTAQAVLALLWREPREPRNSTPRLLATMSLFLFAISFVHFGSGHTYQAWSEELVIHHAGIPLALFVLLQDWRFLMVDALVRVVANAVLALLGAGAVWMLASGRDAAVQVGALAMGFAVFAAARPAVQRALTRILFRQPPPEEIVAAMKAAREGSGSEAEYWQRSLETIAALMKARCIGWRPEPGEGAKPLGPTLVAAAGLKVDETAAVVMPVRVAGEIRWGVLGERRGRQPYLSEDLELLARLAAQVAEGVAQIRQAEVKQLVAEAELRALQAQIHPHFLFNALNTLFGVIPREAAPARRMLLDLSEVFRYFLRAGRGVVTVEEEMQVVRSYLAIEGARLGSKLQSEIEVDPGALPLRIPVLTIQPLVENALKHGVAANPHGGWVRVSVVRRQECVDVAVSDSGCGPDAGAAAPGAGVGLENVRRRLQLSFGEATVLGHHFDSDGSTAGFRVPIHQPAPSPTAKEEHATASANCR